MAEVRRYMVNASSTDTGEELTPVEIFLQAVAACGVELVQVIAKSEQLPLKKVAVEISSTQDRSRPVRPDVSLLNSVDIKFRLYGVSRPEGERLIGAFQQR
jgi:uncharacterized OsmC-like protein